MIVYFVFLLFSLLWLGIIFLGPYLCFLGADFALLKNIYYFLFRLICHQKPERSYFIWGYQLPVCVRCLGIYTGIVIGAFIYPLFKNIKSTAIPEKKFLPVFLAPIFIDGLAQIFNLYFSPHYIRFLTGIIASIALVFYTLPFLQQLYSRLVEKNRKFENQLK